MLKILITQYSYHKEKSDGAEPDHLYGKGSQQLLALPVDELRIRRPESVLYRQMRDTFFFLVSELYDLYTE